MIQQNLLFKSQPPFRPSIGFDVNLLLESLSKIPRGLLVNDTDLETIAKAKNFYESVLQFCEGIHYVNPTGLSSAEAFSLFIRAMKFEGDIHSVESVAKEQLNTLNKVSRDTNIQEVELVPVVQMFKSLSNQLQNNSYQSFGQPKELWRL